MSKRIGWADKARAYARAHMPARSWRDKDIKALADLLRITHVKAYGDGFNEGADYMKVKLCGGPFQ